MGSRIINTRLIAIDMFGGSMILCDAQIKSAYQNSDIRIIPFNEKQLQPASYDLLVGSEGVITSRSGTIDLSQEKVLELKPGDFAIVTVYEEIKIGPQYVGRFGLRSSFARRGLIATTGPQIDPGYHGRLIVGITNLTPHDVSIAYREKFLSVEFHKLQQAVLKPYDGPYQGRMGLTGEEMRVVRETGGVPLVKIVESVDKINKKVHGQSTTLTSVSAKLSNIKWTLGIALSILGVILASLSVAVVILIN